MSLLQTYSEWQASSLHTHNLAKSNGSVHHADGNVAAAEEEAERASQLKALLKLLMNLTQSFDSDVSSHLAEVWLFLAPQNLVVVHERILFPGQHLIQLQSHVNVNCCSSAQRCNSEPAMQAALA